MMVPERNTLVAESCTSVRPWPGSRLLQTLREHGERNVAFGTELKEERERRGVGLSAIAERTKVSERHLRALEEGAHDQLPGGIFNKGIVRGYCQHLELDETEWLERYAASVETAGGEPDWNSFAENVKRNRQIAGAARKRWWGVAGMVLLLAALVWVLWQYVLKPRMEPSRPAMPTAGMSAPRTYDSV
jgi:cytoskeleton protein RodZ